MAEPQYPIDAVTQSAIMDGAEPMGLGMSLDDLVKNHKSKSSNRGGGGGARADDHGLKVRARVIRKKNTGGGFGGGRGGGGFGGRGGAGGAGGPKKVRGVHVRRMWGETRGGGGVADGERISQTSQLLLIGYQYIFVFFNMVRAIGSWRRKKTTLFVFRSAPLLKLRGEFVASSPRVCLPSPPPPPPPPPPPNSLLPTPLSPFFPPSHWILLFFFFFVFFHPTARASL